jgi:putative tryptophan/tyrosine transport system substrate-binding protein
VGLAAVLRRLIFAATAAGLALFASAAAAEEPLHHIGFLTGAPQADAIEAWLKGLHERGWVVGGNLLIEYRYYHGQSERIPVLAAELAALGPELIVASAPAPALAVQAAAPTIPLVFVNVADPIALRLVDSLAHPGGNATGVATIVPEGFTGKQLQLLKELVPQASRIAVLINPKNPIHQRTLAELPEIGRQLGVMLIIVEASGPDQLETAFEAATKQSAEAIDVFGDPLTGGHSAEIVALAAHYRLPAIYFSRQSAGDGGLVSFGPNQADSWRRAGTYVDKILKGERPADLPVEQPTGYHLAVNLKTAAALGITVPPLILAEADEVIE